MDTSTPNIPAEHPDSATMASASHNASTEASASQAEETSMRDDRGDSGARCDRGHTRNYSKGNANGRGAPSRRTRRSDMGRAEWRYLNRYRILSPD